MDETCRDMFSFILIWYAILKLDFVPSILISSVLGLGELTFLQLSTRYHPPSVMGHCVGYVVYSTNIYALTPPQVLC